MRKLLLPLLLAVVMVMAGCGKKSKDTAAETPSASAVESASPAVGTPKPSGTSDATGADGATGKVDTGSTNIERMSPEDVADKVIADDKKENVFVGQWRAVGTTSENASFSALTLDITKDGYTVTMSFDNYDGTTTYEGKYTVKDGVLTFDENFLDCTAYFYKGDAYTLVLDNGTSLVLCQHLEQEKEMR